MSTNNRWYENQLSKLRKLYEDTDENHTKKRENLAEAMKHFEEILNLK